MTVRAGKLGGRPGRHILTRRELLLSAAAIAAGSKLALAQKRLRQIGFIEAGSRQGDSGLLEAFRGGMRGLGWAEGRDFTVIDRWAEGNISRLPGLVDEVIWSGIDILVTGAAPAAIAAGNVTRTIPVVLVGEPDPVAFGLAQSLAQPGGNVTGLTSQSLDLVERQFRMLHDTVPRLVSLATLAISQEPSAEQRWRYVETAARQLRLRAIELKAATPGGLERAFVLLHNYPCDALWVDFDGSVAVEPAQVIALAAAERLPAIYPSRRFAAAGGLMSCGPDFADLFRRSASFVDKILKGANPGDLPFEMPVKLDLAVNTTTAKALGLRIPQPVLASADKIIETGAVPKPVASAASAASGDDKEPWYMKSDRTGN